MSSKALRRTLVGLEATAGESVVTNKPLRALTELHPVTDKVQVDEDVGSLSQVRHYLGSYHAEGSIAQDGIYEEAPWLVAMALGHDVPTGPVAGIYTWAFPLPVGTAPTFATFTMEYTDGADWITAADDVFATSLSIEGAAGKSWDFSNSLVGAEVGYSGALTADLTVSGCVTSILMADTSLYFDNFYDSLGGCLVSGVFIDFKYSVDNLQHQKQFAGSDYPTGRGNDRYDVTLDLTLEVDAAVTRFLRDKDLSDNGLAIRVEADDGTYSATIDGWYFVDSVATLSERDGNNVIAISLKGETDCDDNTGTIGIVCTTGTLGGI